MIARVFVFVGPSGSGKSTCAEYLERRYGFTRYEASKRMTAVVPLSLPQPERLAAVEVFLKANGPGFLGRSVAEDILATELSSPTDGQRVVVSGFRTVQEVEAIRRAFPCVVIGVESSLEVRLTRLTERGRNDHSGSQEAFIRLNGWEYSLGLGRLIYEADHILLNDGPLALLQAQLDTIARSHT